MKLVTTLTKSELKSLLTWAYTSGLNNVSEHYFSIALTETLNSQKYFSEDKIELIHANKHYDKCSSVKPKELWTFIDKGVTCKECLKFLGGDISG